MSSTDATPPKFVKKTFTLEIRNTFRLRNFSTIGIIGFPCMQKPECMSSVGFAWHVGV